MIERLTRSSLQKKFLPGLALSLFGVFAILAYTQLGFSYKDVIVAMGVVILAVIVFGGERGIRYGLVLWVLTLSLGYRTIEVTPNLRIHPAEILWWIILLCFFAPR